MSDNIFECGLCSIQIDWPKNKISNIRQNQLDDPDMNKIIHCFETNNHPDEQNWVERGYIMNDGILYRYIPEGESEDAQLV